MGEYDRIAQAMAQQRPADPLRWLRDLIPENKDGGLSTLNMIRSALGTSANWLDGTRDPSRIGPEEMVAPLGLAGMGTGLANALSRPGRDFRIGDDLARQHPGASAVGDVPRFAPLRDAGNPTSAAHVADFGSMPGARATVNTNRTPSEEIARAHALADENKARTAALADETKRMQDDIRSPEIKTDQRTLNMLRELDAMWRQPKYDETVRPFPSGGKGGPRGLMADNAKGSAPGTVVNSLEQPQTIRAYHGSPHDFDKFDVSKVGTGEGWAEFGPGLYFAEKEAVARKYRDDLAQQHNVPKGHMYEVGIRANPNQMIDMDLPLDKQPQAARDAIASARETIARQEGERRGIPADQMDQYVAQYVESEFRDSTKLAIRDFDSKQRGKALADAARNHGVPGVRYLDGASRADGAGSRNYVVFDDSLVDINRKYARPDIASAPGLAANSTQQQTPPIDAEMKRRLLDALMRGSPDA